jgi:hypothetical protein
MLLFKETSEDEADYDENHVYELGNGRVKFSY